MSDAEWRRELARLVAAARGGREVDALLAALLTPTEHRELAKRWQIVRRLIEGVAQRTIRHQLAASIATVTRGSREVQYGNGTFQKFYQRLYRREMFRGR